MIKGITRHLPMLLLQIKNDLLVMQLKVKLPKILATQYLMLND